MTTTAAGAAGAARPPVAPAAPAPAETPRVLVALDGSAEAEAALPRALAFAVAHRAAVSVVRVVSGGGAVAGPGGGPLAALQAAGTDLEAIAARLQAGGRPPQHLRLAVRIGRCPATALDQARREGAEWVFLPPPAPGWRAVLVSSLPERFH
jgi:nucleotide-binding universal stress UspA family protein